MIAIGTSIGSQVIGGGGVPPSDWILTTGTWNDSNFWRDTENWID